MVKDNYRYTLTRKLDTQFAAAGSVVWIMLNPSTATADTDDPTIRKVVGFSHRFLFSDILVVNLFAARATDPYDLRRLDDPVGPDNDQTIAEAVAAPESWVVAAWGVPRWKFVTERADSVLGMIADSARVVWRLGEPTKDGHPRHPLYVPYRRTRLKIHQIDAGPRIDRNTL